MRTNDFRAEIMDCQSLLAADADEQMRAVERFAGGASARLGRPLLRGGRARSDGQADISVSMN